MTTIYPGIDFHTAVMYRVYQCVGLAFLFVPINTLSFVGVKPRRGTRSPRMINLFRNLGGSIGISAVATLLSRRAQVHQVLPVGARSNYDAGLRSSLAGKRKPPCSPRGSSLPDAALQANGRIYARRPAAGHRAGLRGYHPDFCHLRGLRHAARHAGPPPPARRGARHGPLILFQIP